MMKLQLFADDANIFLLGKDHEHLIDSANFELSEIVTWLQANKFSLNIKKTNCMLSKTHTCHSHMFTFYDACDY